MFQLQYFSFQNILPTYTCDSFMWLICFSRLKELQHLHIQHNRIRSVGSFCARLFICLFIWIFRLHQTHSVHKMRSIARDFARSVVCVSVCGSHGCTVHERLTWSRCRLGADCCGPNNPCVLDGGNDRTNPFAAAGGDKSMMLLFAKFVWTLATTSHQLTYFTLISVLTAIFQVDSR